MSEAKRKEQNAASHILLGDSHKALFGQGQKDYAPSQVAISELSPFPDHPFQLYTDERMAEMVESVKEHGIIAPILVRPCEAGGYEIVAGYNRVEAARQAGMSYIPATVRDLDDETATIIMVDSNLRQRDQLLPSEKAFAYRMKLEAIKKQGERLDLTSRQVVGKLEAADPQRHIAAGRGKVPVIVSGTVAFSRVCTLVAFCLQQSRGFIVQKLVQRLLDAVSYQLLQFCLDGSFIQLYDPLGHGRSLLRCMILFRNSILPSRDHHVSLFLFAQLIVPYPNPRPMRIYVMSKPQT